MPSGRRRVLKPLSPAKKKAVERIKKIIESHKKDSVHFETISRSHAPADPRWAFELSELGKEHQAKARKGEALIKKIKKSNQAERKKKPTIKELSLRAKPWAETILKNRNFVSAQTNAEQRRALEKLVAGKRVTRAEMNDIIDVTREYRGIIRGETKYLRQTGRI
jgi:hypothetical protein